MSVDLKRQGRRVEKIAGSRKIGKKALLQALTG